MATFTKLKTGAWGLRLTANDPKSGTVSVVTRDGRTKQCAIGAVVWSGNGVSIATIATSAGPSRRDGFGPDRRDGGPRGNRPCYMCGSYYCEGARGGLCEDD